MPLIIMLLKHRFSSTQEVTDRLYYVYFRSAPPSLRWGGCQSISIPGDRLIHSLGANSSRERARAGSVEQSSDPDRSCSHRPSLAAICIHGHYGPILAVDINFQSNVKIRLARFLTLGCQSNENRNVSVALYFPGSTRNGSDSIHIS